MIRVGLITNWLERCGTAEYASDLITHSPLDIHFKVITTPFDYAQMMRATEDVDIVHVNYAGWMFRHITPQQWWSLKRGSKRMLVTYHESRPDNISLYRRLCLSSFAAVDKFVVHEKNLLEDDGGVVHIPQPVQQLKFNPPKVQGKIGTAGCPYPWKGFEQAAAVAGKLGLGFLAIMGTPTCDKLDLPTIRQNILSYCPTAEIVEGWPTQEYIITRLAECAMTVYPYDVQETLYGVSASVRFGQAARRPVVISTNDHFRDLHPYQDEVYVANGDLGITVQQVLEDMDKGKERLSKRVLEDMNWDRCAQLYGTIYREFMG